MSVIGPPIHGVSDRESPTTVEYRHIGTRHRRTAVRVLARIQRTVCSRRHSNGRKKKKHACQYCNICYIFLFKVLSLLSAWNREVLSCSLTPLPRYLLFPLAVQTRDRPGPSGGLCVSSPGGPYPTVPAGQGNSPAAFLNSCPPRPHPQEPLPLATVLSKRSPQKDFGGEGAVVIWSRK